MLAVHLAILFCGAHVAFGATNLSGKWGVRAQTTSGPTTTVGCLADISQSGTALSFTASCTLIGAVTLTGTIDAAAGTFTASGHSESFCSSLTIDGSVARTGPPSRAPSTVSVPSPRAGRSSAATVGTASSTPAKNATTAMSSTGTAARRPASRRTPANGVPTTGISVRTTSATARETVCILRGAARATTPTSAQLQTCAPTGLALRVCPFPLGHHAAPRSTCAGRAAATVLAPASRTRHLTGSRATMGMCARRATPVGAEAASAVRACRAVPATPATRNRGASLRAVAVVTGRA